MCKCHLCFPSTVFNSLVAAYVLFGLSRAESSDMGRLVLISQPTQGNTTLKLTFCPMHPLGSLLRHCKLTGAKLSLRFYRLKSSPELCIQAINDLWLLSGQLNQWPTSTELSNSKMFWRWYKTKSYNLPVNKSGIYFPLAFLLHTEENKLDWVQVMPLLNGWKEKLIAELWLI